MSTSRDPFITTYEIAAEMNVSHQTVCVWLRRGQLKGSKRGREWYIRRSWFDEFLAPTNTAGVA